MNIEALDLSRDGCVLVKAIVPDVVCGAIRQRWMSPRLHAARVAVDDPDLDAVRLVLSAVAGRFRTGTKAVRCVYFDKSPDHNWLVPWHQDRTIAVAAPCEVDGFGPWSTKACVLHVEPPFEYLAEMLTLRFHIDPCGWSNAPLEVAIGSHRRKVAASDALSVAEGSTTLTCTADAGDVWVYTTPILHRSAKAIRPERRRVLQFDFSARRLPDGLDWTA